jgi:class 3 adenylate cyclase/CHASE2 domain-containing sensor protein
MREGSPLSGIEPGLTRRRSAAAVLAIAAVGFALQFAPPSRQLELALLDAQFALLRELGPKPVADNIAIVGIDEATLAAFPEPIALWHHRLAGILDGLTIARPRAVGVDIELPERSYDFVQPGLDAALLQSLHGLRSVAPLVLARGVDQGGRVKPVFLPFLAVAGADGAGLATWPIDQDVTVRRFDERQGEGGAAVPTLSGVLARRLKAATDPGLIDFALGPRFGYTPAHDVAAWAAAGDEAKLRATLGNRVVLVGSVLPFKDRHSIPVGLAAWEDASTAPGVLIHAQALRSLLGPGLIGPAPAAAVLAIVAAAACLWFAFARLSVGAAALTLFAAVALAGSTWLLARGVQVPIAGALVVAALASGSRVGYEAWFNRRSRLKLRRAFAGAVSPNVLDLILRGELDSEVGSGRRQVCVMFGDIRGFTPLSERTSAEQMVTLLNRYFTHIVAVVHRHRGTVDNFRGDGIMCIFGAPQSTPDPCRDGFLAAQEVFQELEVLNRELASEWLPQISIGLSLAYGEAVVGRIGSPERNEYTAIGDVANVSARIEALSAEVGYPLVVAEDVAAAVRDLAAFDALGERTLKGHSPVRVFGWPSRAKGARAAGRAA